MPSTSLSAGEKYLGGPDRPFVFLFGVIFYTLILPGLDPSHDEKFAKLHQLKLRQLAGSGECATCGPVSILPFIPSQYKYAVFTLSLSSQTPLPGTHAFFWSNLLSVLFV